MTSAQSLSIRCDSISLNLIIVFDDKEALCMGAHCRIIVLLVHSALSMSELKKRTAANKGQRGWRVMEDRVAHTWTQRLSRDSIENNRTSTY